MSSIGERLDVYGINLQKNPRELAGNFTGIYVGLGIIAIIAIAALVIGLVSLNNTTDKDK